MQTANPVRGPALDPTALDQGGAETKIGLLTNHQIFRKAAIGK